MAQQQQQTYDLYEDSEGGLYIHDHQTNRVIHRGEEAYPAESHFRRDVERWDEVFEEWSDLQIKRQYLNEREIPLVATYTDGEISIRQKPGPSAAAYLGEDLPPDYGRDFAWYDKPGGML